MRQKIYQKETSGNGDCLKACVCSLFGWREYYVPNFMRDGKDHWREQFVEFMAKKQIGVICFPVADDFALERFKFINRFATFQAIIAVKSFTHDGELHAVIGRVTNGVIEIVHDPNKDNAGKQTADYTIREIIVFFRSF